MRNPVVRVRSRYRNFRPDAEQPRAIFHISVSFVFAVLLTAGLTLFQMKALVVDNINAFNGFARTMFALLFTVIAFILAFEEQFSNNRAIQELRRTGHYSNIYRRFFISVTLVGFVMLYSVIITVFGLYQLSMTIDIPLTSFQISDPIKLVTVFSIMFGLLLTIIRVSSCFFVYYRIERIIRKLQDRD